MLHIEREILQLAHEADAQGPRLPAPDCIADAVERLLQRQHLTADDHGKIAITEERRAALAE